MAIRRKTVAETKGTTVTQPSRTAARTPPEALGMWAGRVLRNANASYERRLVLHHVVRPEQAAPRQHFEAVAWACATCCHGAG